MVLNILGILNEVFVCIYYEISVLLKIKNIHYLQECINFEIKSKHKLVTPWCSGYH